jgi:ESS family glutamate:Na+ symporter
LGERAFPQTIDWLATPQSAAMTAQADPFVTLTIAMCVFFIGGAIVTRVRPFREFSIPESVVGGFGTAIVITLIYLTFGLEISFETTRRDLFLAYFFSALGLRSNVREIFATRRPLLLLVLLATVFILVQNGVGMAIAVALDHHPKLGIVAGSMALMGRSGTTIAWAPLFEDRFGLENVSRFGLGATMTGLIAACCISGPIARFLIHRHRLTSPGQSADLDVGISRDVASPKLDYRAVLLALLRIHIAIILGQLLIWGLAAVGVALPLYVTCLLAGLLLGNLMRRYAPTVDWHGSDQCLSLIADVSLGLFYTITLMSMQLWTTQGMLGFLLLTIAVQALVATLYTCICVFRVMGRDYDAAVIAGGFLGMSLGSTATTMAIMTAVAKQYGRAPRAFVIMPLACGLLIDIINSVWIAVFAAL